MPVEPSKIPIIKSEYIQGLGSIRELSEKYGQPVRALMVRGSKEGWTQEREIYLKRIEQKTMEHAETEVEEWLKEAKSTCRNEWNYITNSVKSLVESGQGIDADTIAAYARARKSYNEMIRQSLGLSDINLDVKSGGKSLSESMADALEKLHALNKETKPLTPEEIDLVINCEIIKEEPK